MTVNQRQIIVTACFTALQQLRPLASCHMALQYTRCSMEEKFRKNDDGKFQEFGRPQMYSRRVVQFSGISPCHRLFKHNFISHNYRRNIQIGSTEWMERRSAPPSFVLRERLLKYVDRRKQRTGVDGQPSQQRHLSGLPQRRLGVTGFD